MAPKAMKRSASKSAGGARKKRATPVAKKCAIIAPTIKAAESLPQPVRSIISDRLVHVFGTYKEERHPFQKTVSDLVGQTLKTTQSGLQDRINEATASKAGVDAEGATLSAASNNANAAADAAAKASDDSKQAAVDQANALKDAKTKLSDLENEGKTAESTKVTKTNQKEKLEASIKEFYNKVTEGTLEKGLGRSSTWAAKQLGKEFDSDLQKEFLVCVERTFSKPSSTWGTFDRIVQKELDKFLKQILARLEFELKAIEDSTGPRAQRVEAAGAAVTSQEEKLKAAQEASNNAANAAKDAKKAAKEAASAVKQHESKTEKAARALSNAEDAMKEFQNGPLDAYKSVEALERPPPPPAQPEEPAQSTRSAPTVDEAMTAAPPKTQRPTPSVLPSPGVLFSQAAQGLARAAGLSPRISQSPR